jgi:hypothetical protein
MEIGKGWRHDAGDDGGYGGGRVTKKRVGVGWGCGVGGRGSTRRGGGGEASGGGPVG